MRTIQPVLVMAMAFCLFAFFGLAQSEQPGRAYRSETAIEWHGNSDTDDTCFIKAGLPCTTQYIDLGHYQTLIVTAYDTLKWLANDEDSCLYRIILCVSPEHNTAGSGTFADTSHSGFVRIDSTVVYKTIQIAAESTYVHTRKVFSQPSDLQIGEKAFLIVQPQTGCDSCLVEVSYFMQE